MADKTLSLPEPRFKVSDEVELHMSYGMFNDIMRILGSNEDVTYLLLNDSTSRDLVLRRLFTDNKKPLTDEAELISSFDLPIAPSEMSKILAWVADHACYFLQSMGKELNLTLTKYAKQEKMDEENQSSQPSKSGSTT